MIQGLVDSDGKSVAAFCNFGWCSLFSIYPSFASPTSLRAFVRCLKIDARMALAPTFGKE